MLQLPFGQMYVLPAHCVGNCAWKSEQKIYERSTRMVFPMSSNKDLSASNVDLRERLLERLVDTISVALNHGGRGSDHSRLKVESLGIYDSRISSLLGPYLS